MEDINLAVSPLEESEESRVRSILICNTVVLVLASVGIFVKLLMLGHPRQLAADGILCIISWLFAFVLCFTAMWMTRYGYGKHIALVGTDIPAMTMFLRLIVVTAISYLISLAAIKISLCLLYIRLFAIAESNWPYLLVICFVICQFIEELFVFVFQCSPVRKLVDGTGLVQGKCINLQIFYYVSFGLRLATDIAILTLPIPKLLKLQMSARAKAGLLFIFGLGLLVCATSIVRVTYIRKFDLDYTWDLVPALNWSAVEICVAIFIACIPSWKALINHISPFLRKAINSSSGSKHHQHSSEGNDSNPTPDYFSIPIAQKKRRTPDCFPLPSPMVEDIEVPRLSMSGRVPILIENVPRVHTSEHGRATFGRHIMP